MTRRPRCLSALCAALVLAGGFAPPAMSASRVQDGPADTVEEVVVTARRSGAPMWTVTRGDSTLLLVGTINGLPRDFDWRPGPLGSAAERAQLILLPQEGRASLSDLFRMIWRIRTISRMPEGQSTSDYLTPDWQARLDAVMAAERNDNWRRQSLLLTGFDLMQDKAGFTGRGGADDAADVVRRAARKARIINRPVGLVRGDEIVDSLITAPQGEHVACVQSAIAAAETGKDASRQRAEDWRAFRVQAVVSSPLEQALGQCWPWGDPSIAPQLHRQWAEAIENALNTPGVTMAVIPLRLLGETDGVLDGLKARGMEIDGPAWRAD